MKTLRQMIWRQNVLQSSYITRSVLSETGILLPPLSKSGEDSLARATRPTVTSHSDNDTVITGNDTVVTGNDTVITGNRPISVLVLLQLHVMGALLFYSAQTDKSGTPGPRDADYDFEVHLLCSHLPLPLSPCWNQKQNLPSASSFNETGSTARGAHCFFFFLHWILALCNFWSTKERRNT